MIKPGRAPRRRLSARALPRVEPDVMMITAGREENRAVSVTLRDLESKHVAIERERPLQVAHLQVHVPNAGFRVNRVAHGFCVQPKDEHRLHKRQNDSEVLKRVIPSPFERSRKIVGKHACSVARLHGQRFFRAMNSKLGLGIAIGVAIGTAIGVMIDQIAMGIGIGIALGIAMAPLLKGSEKK